MSLSSRLLVAVGLLFVFGCSSTEPISVESEGILLGETKAPLEVGGAPASGGASVGGAGGAAGGAAEGVPAKSHTCYSKNTTGRRAMCVCRKDEECTSNAHDCSCSSDGVCIVLKDGSSCASEGNVFCIGAGDKGCTAYAEDGHKPICEGFMGPWTSTKPDAQ